MEPVSAASLTVNANIIQLALHALTDYQDYMRRSIHDLRRSGFRWASCSSLRISASGIPIRFVYSSLRTCRGAGLLRNRSFVQSRLTISRSFRNSNPSALAGSKAPNSTLEQDT